MGLHLRLTQKGEGPGAANSEASRFAATKKGRPAMTKVQGGEFVIVPNTLRRSGITDGAIVTYQALLEFAWGPGHEYFRVQAALAESRGKSVRAIRDHLTELEAVGAIRIERRGKRRPNIITICEYDAIGVLDEREEPALRIGSDRQKSALRIGGDRQLSAATTGRNLPLHREVDNPKQIALVQSERAIDLVELELDALEQLETRDESSLRSEFPGKEAVPASVRGPVSWEGPVTGTDDEPIWRDDGVCLLLNASGWADFGHVDEIERRFEQLAATTGRRPALLELNELSARLGPDEVIEALDERLKVVLTG